MLTISCIKPSKFLILFVILLAGLMGTVMATAQEPSNLDAQVPSYVPGQLLVTLKNQTSDQSFHSRMLDAIPNSKGSIKWESASMRTSLIQVNIGDELAQIQTLQQNPNVESVELNTIQYVRGSVVSTDPNFSSQWHLNTVHAPGAWNYTVGSPDTTVAVIDTGIEWTHSDLSSGIWNNTDDSCIGGVDDDVNGKIDDCRGWDFVNKDNDPIDDNHHGTFVSGIIGARLNNIDGASMAPNISLMPLKVLSASGLGTLGNVTAAITYAVDNGADVINMSLGAYGTCTPSMQAAADYAYSRNVSLVVAAGESNPRNIDLNDSWPLCDHVISVTATDNFNHSTHYSDWISTIDLSAPGGDTQASGGPAGTLAIFSTSLGNSFAAGIGTSFAAPHVSGCAALIKTLNSTMNSDVLQVTMEDTALDLQDSGYSPNLAEVGKDKVFGWGLLQCDDALFSVINPPSFTIQYFSDSNQTLPLGDNPKLKAGTYYIKITSDEALSSTPTISIDAQGTVNDITNATTSSISGHNYKYTRVIASDAAATGTILEDVSITGTDITINISTNVNPTNEPTKAAYIDQVNPTFTIQYYSDVGLTIPLGDNPKLKAGTYYIKITSNEALSASPTISIDAQGTANDVTNATSTSVSGNDYVYTRVIASDAAAIGGILEDLSITGTDIATNTSTADPTNESTKAAFTDTVSPIITSVTPLASKPISQFNIRYTLSETVSLGTIKFTQTGGSVDGSVHTYNLAANDKSAGAHIIQSTALGGGFGSLVNGAIYTMTISATDDSSNQSADTNTLSLVYSTPTACSPPGGNWTINFGCIISTNTTAPGNVDVQNNAIVTIQSGGILDIDFATKYLKIHSGSSILIKSGGKIK